MIEKDVWLPGDFILPVRTAERKKGRNTVKRSETGNQDKLE